ncbi:hypothetical protein [Bermanella sp. R86510]|uniref:hypothetical protein n=1 Tax=unclassified Bermanella TaxID=2627862 RepID=UPI0037C54B41
MHTQLRYLLLITLAIFLSGCATYGSDVRQGLNLTEQGQFDKAAAAFEKALDPLGDDRLLYYTELGVVYHLAGDYQKSNQLLNKAEAISEELYTRKVSDMLEVAMSNPRQGPYRGSDFERVFINYYKALNYFMLAAENNDNPVLRTDALEGARVESRRMDMILSSIEFEKGNYQEQADKEKSLFSKLLRIFERLNGEIIDKDKLIYRNDAFGHYLAGVIYEQHKEWDSARVAYQKSASLYEAGYQKQFSLSENMTEQAWFDTIRMMQRGGGWANEWPRLSQSKLSASKRELLKEFNRKGHLLVIEHQGKVPERHEMNMLLTADQNTRQIVIHPILTGDAKQQLDQRFWFFALYADKGLTDVISAVYEGRTIPALLQFGMVKREYLGPLWDVADGLGLINVLLDGMRITVPYYRASDFKPYGESRLMVDNQWHELVAGQSVQHLAFQQQLVNASNDIQEAMARASFKNLTAAQAASIGGDAGAVLGLLGKITANATSAAETRNWLLLPGRIKVSRIPLEAGEHNVKLVSDLSQNRSVTHEKSVTIKPNEMSVWKVRSFAAQPKRDKQQQAASSQTLN